MPAHLLTRRTAQNCRIAILALVVLAVISGCGGPTSPAAAPDATSTIDASATAPNGGATVTPTGGPCAGGNLRIGDLAAIDGQWRQGLDRANARAEEWQSDAMLTSFRVGCEVLGPGFRWQATFYSPTSQAYFASDTGETVTSEIDPTKVSPLPTDRVSFGLLRRALIKAGYSDEAELTAATGVEIRLNSRAMPFGPPAAPENVVLYHVAVLYRGEVKDLFVSSIDGSVYRYSF